ncbi:MAG: polysaccharide biosynthesis protein, partial [Candidatus Cryptobacteroides sp.]
MNLLQKLSNYYFSKKALPYWCILLIDCAAVAFSFFFACYLKNGGDVLARSFWQITFGTLVSLIPFVICFRIFHTYTGIVRYSSFVDLQKVATACFVGSGFAWVLGLVVNLIWPGQSVIMFPNFISV